jgi:hypothetical protein
MILFINGAETYALILSRALNRIPRPGWTDILMNRGYTSIVTLLVLSKMGYILISKKIRYLFGQDLIPKMLSSTNQFHVRKIGNSYVLYLF